MRLRLVTFAALLLAGPGLASSPPRLSSLFPHRAEIRVAGDGLARLPLPAEVLAQCRADLSDLRILDLDGRETPYLVDSGLAPETRLEVTQSFRPEILEVRRAAEEREGAPDRLAETYVLSTPDFEPDSGAWELVVDSRARRWVRAVRVRAVSAGGEETLLAADASLFRLTDPAEERRRLALPPFAGERLVVELSGEEPFFLEPTFVLEASRPLPPGELATVELAIGRGPPADRATVLEVERPRGLVPDLLEIATTTEAFHRRIEVWDEGPDAAVGKLAAATILRLGGDPAVESTRIELAPARGDRLRLVIDDGDSPPLAAIKVRAVVRRPALIFSLAGGGEAEPAGVLLFGGGRAFRPRYDLAGLLPPRRGAEGDTRARLLRRLYDPARLARARLGPVTANPAFDPAPALAFAMQPGAAIDRRAFSHRLQLEAPESAEGLLRLRIQPAVAALARRDLGDLRLVDRESRQWPYLLDGEAGYDELPAEIAEPETEAGVSAYRVRLPLEPLELQQLLLDSQRQFFDRPYKLVGEAFDGEGTSVERVLARGRLVRRPGDPRKLRIDFARGRYAALELRVTDGDDAPLPLADAAVRVPATDLYFTAPGGRYALLFGNPQSAAPAYELARVRDVVLTVESTPVEPAAVTANPDFRPASHFTRGGAQRILLWAALAVAVAVLVWFTLRLSRGEG